MQIFVKTVEGSTVVLEVDTQTTVLEVCKQLSRQLDDKDYRLLFAGHQLETKWTLSKYAIQDCSTLYCAFRLRGGSGEMSAATRIKLAREAAARSRAMEALYRKWFRLADRTPETGGSMRLLCVSMALKKHLPCDLVKIPADETASESLAMQTQQREEWFATDTSCYQGKSETGFISQSRYNDSVQKIFEDFAKHYGCMEPTEARPENLNGSFKFTSTAEASGSGEWTLTYAENGLWYGGPIKIEDGSGKLIWDLEEAWREQEQGGMMGPPPSSKSAECEAAGLERWIYEGIGTTTFFTNSDKRIALWGQQDTEGPMALTDGERRLLAERCKLFIKKFRKDYFRNAGFNAKEGSVDLTGPEQQMEEKCNAHVEAGPCHRPEIGIFQWRIKSLKKRLVDKCVFWTNAVDLVPGGSVADSTRSAPGEDGEGFELMEFYKYKQKIGVLRKAHIMEDRQRLLDQIETFTPDYKAVIKYKGSDADDEGGSDHYMVDRLVQKMCDIAALAMDMHMPDYDEDKIACFIKTLIEKHVGPTWHVLVGRSFGFVIQCEARHFLHLYMRHLAIVIWKSEPDIQKGASRSMAGQAK